MRGRTWLWLALGALALITVCCIGALLGGALARREAAATQAASQPSSPAPQSEMTLSPAEASPLPTLLQQMQPPTPTSAPTQPPCARPAASCRGRWPPRRTWPGNCWAPWTGRKGPPQQLPASRPATSAPGTAPAPKSESSCGRQAIPTAAPRPPAPARSTSQRGSGVNDAASPYRRCVCPLPRRCRS